MLNFFFVISKEKFVRIDLADITQVIQTKDHAQIHTVTGVYTPSVSSQKIKELLPNDEFAWINETTAVPRVIPNKR